MSRSAPAPRSGRTCTSAVPDTRLGVDCIVGERTYVAYGVQIGDRVKLNAGVYVCTGVTLGTGVLVGAGVVFTNDRYPRATTPDLAHAASLGARRPHAADDGGGRRDHRRRQRRSGAISRSAASRWSGMGAVVDALGGAVPSRRRPAGAPGGDRVAGRRAPDAVLRRPPAGPRGPRLPGVGAPLRGARRRRRGARPTVTPDGRGRPSAERRRDPAGQRVAVVGGGALGLRLAWHLAAAGRRGHGARGRTRARRARVVVVGRRPTTSPSPGIASTT